MKYINGTMNNTRELTFDCSGVYAGEQNGIALKIDVSQWKNENAGFYILNFETAPFERFESERITEESTGQACINGNYLIYVLPSALTASGMLRVQAAAHWVIGGTEVIEKSSVALLEFEPSIRVKSAVPKDEKSVYASITELESRVRSLEENRVQDVDYLLVVAASSLLYSDGASTPVYVAESIGEAAERLEDIVENTDFSLVDYAMVVVPSQGAEPAKLAVVYKESGNIKTGLYSGKTLLNILRNGVVNE